MITRLDDIGKGVSAAAGASGDTPGETAAPAPRLPRYRSGYSRFVRLMKYALPVVAGVVVVLLFIWPELKTEPERFRIGLSDINIETSSGQRVLNARFTGVDGENRPFSVTAASAVQEQDRQGRVDLSSPKADLTLQNASWVAITSPEGVFWRDKEVLDLSGGVELYHDEGYEFRTELARIDFPAGTASGDRPVNGQGPFGTIDAEGFRLIDSGDRILFTGKARMVLYPKRGAGASGK